MASEEIWSREPTFKILNLIIIISAREPSMWYSKNKQIRNNYALRNHTFLCCLIFFIWRRDVADFLVDEISD